MSKPVEEVGTVIRQVESETENYDESSQRNVGEQDELFHDTDDSSFCSGIQETGTSTRDSTNEKDGSSEVYVDLRHSKADKKSIQVEDDEHVGKRGIQVTDSCDFEDLSSSFSAIHTNDSSQLSDKVINDSPNGADKNDFDFCEDFSEESDKKSKVDEQLDKLLEDADSESDEEEDYESAEEGEANEEELKRMEEKMTDKEKEETRKEAQCNKEEGNKLFRDESYKEAIRCYTRALHICSLSFPKDRAIMFSNRAVCKLKLDHKEDAIKDCSRALDLHPHYLKALLRRAELYEGEEKLDEALVDYQQVLELDAGQHSARAACMRLPDQIKERNEKMKAEMLGKLKDLGNMILKPFGLSTDNFQLNQDPNSGGYSVNFAQNSDKK